MCLALDASNIRGVGGGVTHLRELLRAAYPPEYGFSQIFVWGGAATLSELDNRPWLCKMHDPILDRNLPLRAGWQLLQLDRVARQNKCNFLFAPGGVYAGNIRPFVAMSQNMLAFEWAEARRYGVSAWTLKFLLLRYAQSATFKRADGIIFLTEYARNKVCQLLGRAVPLTTIIPHGVAAEYRHPPRISNLPARGAPYRLLYISTIAPYKHQWRVIQAAAQLRQSGVNVTLELIGALGPASHKFFDALNRLDPVRAWVHYRGEVSSHDELRHSLEAADVFVFASSCETISITLLEAMASGLPIACSNRGPMPEVLGEAGVYFDPEQPAQIAAAIRQLLDDPALREQKAWLAYERAKAFTWERCAQETFSFLAQVTAGG